MNLKRLHSSLSRALRVEKWEKSSIGLPVLPALIRTIQLVSELIRAVWLANQFIKLVDVLKSPL